MQRDWADIWGGAVLALLGAGVAVHAGLRLDRYWRNLRTHTLHDPIDYKIRELGTWALMERYLTPTFYS